MLLWSVVLLALPAAAQDGTCALDCKTKATATLPACMDRCPATQNPSKDRPFQKCAERCSDAYNAQLETCQKKCGGKTGSGGKKRK
ncbi:hypothetical protein DAT35_05975 [Vitiosangium sp. GDMCC 1.1324]|nr:hypothetical protein DAT35_05975 [Vitiosangium sp. GDMCC 1.1324]